MALKPPEWMVSLYLEEALTSGNQHQNQPDLQRILWPKEKKKKMDDLFGFPKLGHGLELNRPWVVAFLNGVFSNSYVFFFFFPITVVL